MAVNAQTSIDYRRRRGQLSAYGHAINSSRILQWLMLLFGTILIVPVVILLFLQWNSASKIVVLLLIAVAVAIPVGLWTLCRYAHQHFIEPDLAFRKWLQQVCDGDLNARIELPQQHRHHKELDFHTRNLASSLSMLSNDMEMLVDSQTERLERQKRVLDLLFRLTADVASSRDNDQVIETSCVYLSEWFDAATVYGYLVQPDSDKLRLVCVCESGVQPANKGASETGYAQSIPAKNSIETRVSENVSITEVPFYAEDEPAGVLVIVAAATEKMEHRETKQVLTAVSEQLSLAREKTLAAEQAHQSHMIGQRTLLAGEIHDSLAQTLLATRNKATLLLEKLDEHTATFGNDAVLPPFNCYDDVLKIRHFIDEANQEIRGLMREYRQPLSEHRYADSLQELINEFNQSSDAQVFFQSDDPQISFTPREESVLHQIIGEALTNAGKYAGATTIRVYLQRDHSGVRKILVEDDGIGFTYNESDADKDTQTDNDGDHIGLSIMRERALNIGAQLSIDSEPGEGSRISVVMPPLIVRAGG